MVGYEWFWHWHCVIMMKWCRKLRCDLLIFISTFYYFIPFRRMLSIFAVNWKIPSMGYIICVSFYFIWYKIMHYNQTLLISTLKRILFGKVSKTWFVYFIQLSALNNNYFLHSPELNITIVNYWFALFRFLQFHWQAKYSCYRRSWWPRSCQRSTGKHLCFFSFGSKHD